MVSPIFDPVVVQQKIDALTKRDNEFAQRAEVIERDRQIQKYGAPRPYEFAPNTSQVHVTNWVHRGWLRPLRFVYRNTPRSLRKILKRLWI
jgi:hypothetical protein